MFVVSTVDCLGYLLDARQGSAELFGAPIMQTLFEASWTKASLEDSLHCQAVVSVVAHGMYQSLVDVVAVVGVFEK